MIKRALFLSLLIPAIASSAQTHPATTSYTVTDEVKAQCANKWPGNYRMQVHCINSQARSSVEVVKAWDASAEGSEARNIVKRCLVKWEQPPIHMDYSYNYRMVEHCISSQSAAYHQIYGK